MKQFETGKILGQSFKVFFDNLVPFLFVAALFQGPSLALNLVIVTGAWVSAFAVLIQGLMGLLGLVATGAITYGVFKQLRGQKVTLGECVEIGVRRILPVVAVSFLGGLLVGVGFLLLIVPGVILLVRLFVCVPAVVVENPGILNAIRRSSELTKGHTWRVFGLIVVIYLVSIGISALLNVAMLEFQTTITFVMLSWILGVFTTAVLATASALVYYHLRVIKENFDVDEIADIFE